MFSPKEKYTTKRLLRNGTDAPIEVYKAIEELKNKMMFELITKGNVDKWKAFLQDKLRQSVEKHIIKGFNLNISTDKLSDSVFIDVTIQEDNTDEIREIKIEVKS